MQTHTPPDKPSFWLTALLLVQLAYGLLAMTISLPSMPSWIDTWDSPPATVQLTFSGFVVAYGLLQLLYGPLSDRFGRKPLLLTGLAVAGAAAIWAATAASLWELVAARVLQGAGCAAGMVLSRAMVQDLFQGPQRTQVMAYIGMAMGLTPPLATLVGGHLHVRLGWAANFVLLAGLAALLLLVAWRVVPNNRPQAVHPGHWLTGMWVSYRRLAQEPVFWLYVWLLGMTTATFYAFLGGAPQVLAQQGVGPEQLGWYLMSIPFAYFVGNYLTTHLVAKWGEDTILAVGQAGTLAGLALVLGLAWMGVSSPLALALPLVLLGLGHGLLVPPALSGTVGVVPALAGAAAAGAGVMQQLMGAVGGYTVGLVDHGQGAASLGVVMLVYALGASLALAGLLWRPRQLPTQV
ncbi:MAG: hypothetical protein RJA09_435 [Pseudomonadota bacterium]